MTPESESEDIRSGPRTSESGSGVGADSDATRAAMRAAAELEATRVASEPAPTPASAADDDGPPVESSDVGHQAVGEPEPLADAGYEPAAETGAGEEPEPGSEVEDEPETEADDDVEDEPAEADGEVEAEGEDSEEDELDDEEPSDEEPVGDAPKRRRRRRRGGASEEPAAPQPAPTRRRRPRRDPGAPIPVVRAQAKYVRSSARKARLVCDHIRGKSVEEARAILAVTPRAIARDWSKLLESAVANAEHNHELVGEDLYIKAVKADEGPTIKRFRPRAMGRASKIRKRTSHLTILLTPKE
jgi:ribosomal protein L22